MVQILEGESLVNDAAALTVYRFAIAAIVSGTFSFPLAALSFVWTAGAGVAVAMEAVRILRAAETLAFARQVGVPVRELVFAASPGAGSAHGRGI